VTKRTTRNHNLQFLQGFSISWHLDIWYLAKASVCLTATLCYSTKTTQATITKSLLSAPRTTVAWSCYLITKILKKEGEIKSKVGLRLPFVVSKWSTKTFCGITGSYCHRGI